MAAYYRIDSRLKASTCVNYLIQHKKNKNQKQSVKVMINGAYRPTDIQRDLIPPTFISKKECQLPIVELY